MPVVDYSRWEKENEHLTPRVVEMLLSDTLHPIQESMLYASRGSSSNIRLLSPKELELLAVSLYSRIRNYKKVRHTGAHSSSDGGVDVWLTRIDGEVEIVQCKQLSSKITREQIKEFVKVMRRVDAKVGYYWAPNGFSSPAVEYIQKNRDPVRFYDADIIAKEVHEMFFDEICIWRDKLDKEFLQENQTATTIPSKEYEPPISKPAQANEIRPMPQKGWKVSQVMILFGMGLLACAIIYCAFSTLVTGGR